jgi:hypothetical protein
MTCVFQRPDIHDFHFSERGKVRHKSIDTRSYVYVPGWIPVVNEPRYKQVLMEVVAARGARLVSEVRQYGVMMRDGS